MISIIIVTWNNEETILECLNSVYASEGCPPFEVIVVDNGSSDETVERIEARGYEDLAVIKNDDNLGFAKGVNIGLAHKQHPWALLLNPDAEVKPDAIKKSYEFMQNNKEVGIVGAKLLNSDGSIQEQLVHFPTITNLLKNFALVSFLFPNRKRETYPKEAYEEITDVDSMMGAFMLIRPEVLNELGGLAEWTFMYSEDMDLCYRAQKAGWRVVYNPEVEVMHHWNASAKKRWGLTERYRKAFVARQKFLYHHHGFLYGQAWKLIFTFDTLLKALLNLTLLRFKKAKRYFWILRTVVVVS